MKYRMTDSAIVDTDIAAQHWDESSILVGNRQVSKSTYEHSRLHKSRKGRYYLERWNNHNSHSSAEWVSILGAARWLTLHGHELPQDLIALAEAVVE